LLGYFLLAESSHVLALFSTHALDVLGYPLLPELLANVVPQLMLHLLVVVGSVLEVSLNTVLILNCEELVLRRLAWLELWNINLD
jgi:hypothetical protein